MTADKIKTIIIDINRSLLDYSHENTSTEELSNIIFDRLIGNNISSRIIRYTYNHTFLYTVQYYQSGAWHNFDYTGLDLYFQPIYSRTLNPQDIIKEEMIRTDNPQGMGDVPGVDPDGRLYTAGEYLYPNNVVNIYTENGVTLVRRADATDNTKPAMGFVKDPVEKDSDALVFFEGYIGGISLTVGADYFLSTTPGLLSPEPPTNEGNIWQRIGVAVDTGNIEFDPTEPIMRG